MKAETIDKDMFHLFIDTEIDKHKARKGRAFFYKKPKRLEETYINIRESPLAILTSL